LPVLACSLALLAAGACGSSSPKDVKISYDQAANFFTYRITPADQPVSAPGAMYIMYRITKIKNSAGIPFTFDKHMVLAGEKGKTRNEEPADDAALLGDRFVNNVQVAPGKTVNDPGCVIKLVNATADTTKLASALIPASYQSVAKMERNTDDNVTTPVTQATSITLRNFCRA